MADSGSYENIGQSLFDRGWRQAAMFDGVGRVYLEILSDGSWTSRMIPPPADEQLIVVSQDCDIIAASEPYIETMPCYTVDRHQPGHFRAARHGNSSRYFLLSSTGLGKDQKVLIADATHRVVVAKSSLLSIAPYIPEFIDDPDKFYRRFRSWLGGRYSRPALDDLVVRTIQAPIADLVESLSEDVALNPRPMLREIRIAPVKGEPPYSLQIIVLLEEGYSDTTVPVANLLGAIIENFAESGDGTRVDEIIAVSAAELSVDAYENTWKLPLDRFTWAGEDLVGSLPVYGIEHG